MPQIELIPVPLYQPLDPYHYDVDNLPIKGLIERVLQVNDQVDLTANDLRTAAGTAGTLTARLQVSINDDGTLLASGINAANHSIEAHEDTASYVRMTAAERAKLSLVASGATDVSLLFETSGGDVEIDNGIADFADSDTVSWRYTAGKLYLDTAFPGVGHRYNLVPTTSDYENYTVPLTPYKANTLKVYVNGIRLNPNSSVRYPSASSTPTWTLLTYTEDDPDAGEFSLSAAISSSDVIVVDYDFDY